LNKRFLRLGIHPLVADISLDKKLYFSISSLASQGILGRGSQSVETKRIVAFARQGKVVEMGKIAF